MEIFSLLGGGSAQIFGQILSTKVKTLSNTNFVSVKAELKYNKREEESLPVAILRSKMSLPMPPTWTQVHISESRAWPLS